MTDGGVDRISTVFPSIHIIQKVCNNKCSLMYLPYQAIKGP